MRSRRAIALAFVITGAAVSVLSCDTPGSPTPIRAPLGRSIEIVGPETVAPDRTVQLTARATTAHGLIAPATELTWTSSRPSVLEVRSDGLATGRARGEAGVSVRGVGLAASRTMMVLPDATYRLVGQVRDQGIVLNAVTVRVIEGVGAGLSARTDSSGHYALYGVAGAIKLQAEREGYQSLTVDALVEAHGALNLDLAPAAPRPDLSGAWALNVVAGSCPPQWPDELRHRTYDATMTLTGPQVDVRLAGADFIVTAGRGNGFTGTLFPENRLTFRIGTAYYYYSFYTGFSEIVERLSDNSILLIGGLVEATYEAGVIGGALTGTFATSTRSVAPFYPYTATCFATNHRFELRRKSP